MQGKLEIQSGNDYVMPESLNTVWITVGNIAVEVKRTGEGVAVDLWPEDEQLDMIASCWATFTEAGKSRSESCTK